MRSIQASLSRMAAVLPDGSELKSLFASLIRVASFREDLFARTSYIEGLMGYNPGSLTKDPTLLSQAREALQGGSENSIVDELRFNRGMSESDLRLMLGNKDTGLFDAMVRGVSTVVTSPVRGLVAEDIAMALAAGISPVTGGPLKYGRGKGVFYHFGEFAPSRVSLNGIKKIVFLEAKNRAKDVLRGTSKGESNMDSIDAPIGTGEDVYTLADILQSEGDVSPASFMELATALYQDPWVMGLIDNEVRQNLTSPSQIAIWEAIKANPDLLRVSARDIGVEARALAMEVAKMTGVPYQGKSSEVAVGATFRSKVWPAMRDAMENSEIADRLLRKRHILEIIQESTKSRPHKEKNPAGISGLPDPSLEVEPARYLDPGTMDPSGFTRAPQDRPAWLQRLKNNPDLKALRTLGLRSAAQTPAELVKSVTKLLKEGEDSLKKAISLAKDVSEDYSDIEAVQKDLSKLVKAWSSI